MSGGFVPDCFKEGFIHLIPKYQNANTPADFRPISLLNAIWKVYTSLIDYRLQPLNNVLHDAQIGWKKGRRIQENLFIVNHWFRNNTPVLFLDFKKPSIL